MNWKKSLFANFRLYAVTDLKTADPDILEKIDAAYRGGADIVQLRSKTLTDRELLSLAKKARSLADRRRKLFLSMTALTSRWQQGRTGCTWARRIFL